MTLWRWLNVLGLGCDVAGAALLFRFGLPPRVNRDGTIFVAEEMRAAGIDHAEARRGKRYERLGYLGLALLLIGFVLQLLSSLFAK